MYAGMRVKATVDFKNFLGENAVSKGTLGTIIADQKRRGTWIFKVKFDGYSGFPLRATPQTVEISY